MDHSLRMTMCFDNVFINDLWPIRPNRELGLYADIQYMNVKFSWLEELWQELYHRILVIPSLSFSLCVKK